MTHGITYLAGGQGPQTLVCLHGIGADGSSFHHQLDVFDGFRVVAWNMPGYQGSEARMSPPDFGHLSDRLAAFLDDLGSPVHILGQSIGGMIAMDHVLRYPSQVKSLTLLTTTPRFGGRDDSFKTAFLKARLAPLDAGQTMAEMAKGAAPHLVGPRASSEEIARIEYALAQVPEQTWRDILRCLVEFDRADDLHQINCPTLVVAGSEDKNAPAKTMEKMAAQIAGAQFHVMNDAGHMPHQEMPEMFNTILAGFLKEVG